MVEPFTAGFIGWVCGKLGDSLLKHLVGDTKLARDVDKVIAEWARSLAEDRYVHPKALFSEVDPAKAKTERPEYCALQAKLVKSELPSKETWHAVFIESWRWVRDNVEGPQPFFCLGESEASKALEKLAQATYDVCVQYEPVFRKAVIDKLEGIDGKVDDIREYQREILGVKLPVIGHGESLHNQTPPEAKFVGCEEMLGSISGWYRNRQVRVGAVVGWGGVGKSALVRKWYDELEANDIRPDGIFWWGFYRNAYLELFLNALLRYVSGEQIEPETIKSTWEKTEKIKEYLGQGTPYLIVLDGLEQMQKSTSGDGFGEMEHREFAELLHCLADGPEGEGLCLITTRYPLKHLDQWETRGYENRPLIDLSVDDSLLMLKERGARGSDEQMIEVINRYKGHALSLTSVAGYLNRYCDRDIKQAPDVEFVLGDEERFKDVNKLLRKYAEKMSESERIFLNIFSLFRQEVTERDFAGVFRKRIEGAGFNNELVEMGKLDFRDLVDGLVDWRLIWYDEMKKTYAAHPLVKGYFESDFEDEDKKLCHKRIYQYFGENAPQRPETLRQMQPLFEQVYHGCAAKLYDEVCDDVYWEKIYRRDEFFIYHKLGAWETNLSLARSFFPGGELSKMPFVSEKSVQSWLLNEAGLALLCTGRPREAEEPFLTGVKMDIEAKDCENASVGYRNLADLQFRAGRLEAALESAKKALETAEKAEHEQYIVNSRAYLGWVLHLSGKDEEAGREFGRADELEGKISGYRLYGQRGVNYASFLLSMGRIDEAFELTGQNFEICERNNAVNDISRCHRCLGAIERTKGNFKGAENHLREALEIARRVGMPELEIEALIELGRLWLDMGRKRDAIGAANEVLKICERTGFKLYEGDAEVIRSKAK